MAQLRVFKETIVPASPVPHAWYLLKQGTNPYFTVRVADSAGTLIPLSVDVLGTALTGFSSGANASIIPTDNVLEAFGKTQGQINNLNNLVAGGVKVPLPLDCGSNPNYPAGVKGDSYIVTVAGRIGGASGIGVTAGDVINCLSDNAGGDQASVGSNWYVIETNQSEANDTTMGYVRRATVTEVEQGTEVNAYVTSGRLRAGVRETILSGINTSLTSAVVGSDSLLIGFGKLQGQINGFNNSLGNYVPETRTVSTGLGLTGGGDLSQNRTISFDTVWGDARYIREPFAMIKSNSALGIDPNTLLAQSSYRINAHPNNPTNTIYAFLTIGNGGNVTSQLASQVSTGETYIRAFNTDWGTWRKVWDSENFNPLAKADKSNEINTGLGLSGGGDLSQNRTISFDTVWGDARYQSSITLSINSIAFGGLAGEVTSSTRFQWLNNLYLRTLNGNENEIVRIGDVGGTDDGIIQLFTDEGVENTRIRANGISFFKERVDLEGEVRLPNISNGTGQFATISDANGQLTKRTTTQVREDIGAVSIGRAILNGNHITGGGNLTQNRTLSVRFTTNQYILDDELNERVYFGNESTSVAGIFRASASAQHFYFRNHLNQTYFDIDADTGRLEEGIIPWSKLAEHISINSSSGITGGGSLSESRTLSLTGQVLAFHNLGTNGFAVRTAPGAASSRTLTGSDSIKVTNGTGVSGDPTFEMKYSGNPSW